MTQRSPSTVMILGPGVLIMLWSMEGAGQSTILFSLTRSEPYSGPPVSKLLLLLTRFSTASPTLF
uniref:Uncharacterized protein n=1 Tax=Arundo donax TaxID=35708 RepID=A0A0A9CWG0_ARUDO